VTALFIRFRKTKYDRTPFIWAFSTRWGGFIILLSGIMISPQCQDRWGRRIREDGNDSPTMERPKKRVRISVEDPKIFHYRTCDESSSEVKNKEALPIINNVLSTMNLPESNDCPDHKTKKRSSWLTRRDLQHFRASAKKLCRSINLDSALAKAYDVSCLAVPDNDTDLDRIIALLENSDYSRQRGLERWCSSQHAFLRSLKIVEVKTAVLLEQSIQFLTGRSDPNKLAVVAQQASIASQKFAQILASADAREASQVQGDYDYSNAGWNEITSWAHLVCANDPERTSTINTISEDEICPQLLP
jgi:hypothetical protein